MILLALVLGLPLQESSQEPDSLLVQLVDGTSGKPMEGATLSWTTHREPIPLGGSLPWGESGFRPRVILPPSCNAEPRLEASIRTFQEGALVSGDDGLISIPAATDEVLFIADAKAMWGSGRLRRGDKPSVVELHPDGPMLVRVLDRHGEPVPGAPVVLEERVPGHGERPQRFERLSSVADAHGVATLPHAGYLMSTQRFDEPSSWFVRTQVAALRPLGLEVHASNVSAAPLELVLPPIGQVEVALVDAAGNATHTRTPPVLTRLGGGWPIEGSTTDPKTAETLFVTVPLGVELLAQVRRNPASTMQRVRFSTPTEEGQRVRVEITLGEDCTTVTGTVVRTDGRAYASRPLMVELHDADLEWRFIQGSGRAGRVVGSPSPTPFQDGWVMTDAEGRFTVDLAVGAHHGTLARPVLILDTVALEPKRLGCSLALPNLVSQQHDLGPVTLDVPPILVSGHVLDRAGAPVVGAEVEVFHEGSPRFGATTGPEGTFHIRTHVPHKDLTLIAKWEGLDRASLKDVEPGTRNLEVRLD